MVDNEKGGSVPTLFSGKNDCCGCQSCAAICPMDAIEMVSDENGFMFPVIHQESCVGCRACTRACGLHQHVGQQTEGPWYAASGNGDVSQSASAGVFVSLAREIIAQGGTVFGAAYHLTDDGLHVSHIEATDENRLAALQNSKYVQSAAGLCFPRVRQELIEGKTVLFCGTPCQVAGLRAFLGKGGPWPNLYTADLVCHGVPSEQMFRDWVESEESQLRQKIVDVRFRCKNNGWGHSLLLLQLQGGSEELIPADRSAYYAMFLGLETLRDSCYVCPYASGFRAGDLTLGDFWGIQKTRPEVMNDEVHFNMKRGISCLLVNNAHGREALEKFGARLNLREVSFNDIASGNDQLRHPSTLPSDRKSCLKAYRDGGWGKVEKWWRWHHVIPDNAKEKTKKLIYRVLLVPVVKHIKNSLKRNGTH